MDCELCGKDRGETFTINLDGVLMHVCRNCTGHGKFIAKDRPEQAPRKKVKETGQEPEEAGLNLEYGKIIQRKRSQLGMTMKELAIKLNEQESVIKRLEHGSMTPPDKLVKKIEKTLGISLKQKQEQEQEKPKNKAETGGTLTLGDVVDLKKK